MTTNLDMKDGVIFEAETEYLYQRKIAELEVKLKIAVEALEEISKTNHGVYCDSHSDDKAREALAKIGDL